MPTTKEKLIEIIKKHATLSKVFNKEGKVIDTINLISENGFDTLASFILQEIHKAIKEEIEKLKYKTFHKKCSCIDCIFTHKRNQSLSDCLAVIDKLFE